MDTFSVMPYNDAFALLQTVRRFAVENDSVPIWVYSYLRFSFSTQEEGDSARRQNALLQSFLNRHPEARLDRGLRFKDEGAVSAFAGKHRTDPKYVLAQFVKHVESGRVASGSYLVVENLDRLTREHWADSVPFVLSLIAKGIRIVQLSPTEVVYDATMDQGRLMMMLWELSRAHGESKLKSERVREAWQAKWEAARQGVPHGGHIPAWIELRDGTYRLRPDAAHAVRTIFRLAKQGLGSLRIKRELEKLSIKAFAGPRWVRGYIVKILSDRATFGECQPRTGKREGRRANGEPIPNYYPAVVTEAEFAAVQNAKRSRKGRIGRPAKSAATSHPFTGLLRCALTGSKLHLKVNYGRTMLISHAAMEGEADASGTCFRLDHFVDGLLSQLREVSASELFNDPAAGEVDSLKAELAQVEDKLKEAVAQWNADRGSSTWAAIITETDKRKRQLQAQVREAVDRAATPASATWAEAVELMKRKEPERLRQCLLETVEAVYSVFVQRTRFNKLAAVQVRFVGGGRRDYLLWSYNPCGVQSRKQKASCVAVSDVEKVLERFDLRDKTRARALARVLEKLDVSRF